MYAATQGLRACNNHNPSLHPLISGYGCYYCCMPSSPVAYILLSFALRMLLLLHALNSCVAAYIFGPVIPTSFNILMEMLLYNFKLTDGPETGDVRHGFVKVFQSGTWVPVTDSSGSWTLQNSNVVCKQLGYNG